MPFSCLLQTSFFHSRLDLLRTWKRGTKNLYQFAHDPMTPDNQLGLEQSPRPAALHALPMSHELSTKQSFCNSLQNDDGIACWSQVLTRGQRLNFDGLDDDQEEVPSAAPWIYEVLCEK